MSPVRTAAIEFAEAESALQAQCALNHPRLREASAYLEEGQFAAATALLKAYLKKRPGDANALYLLAEAALRQGQMAAAERILAECVSRDPAFAPARMSYAQVMLAAERPDSVLVEAEALLKRQPGNPLFRQLKAKALDEAEDYISSAVCWEDLCRDYPDWSEGWISYGHALKVLGRQKDSIAAYRTALKIDPDAARAYWGLASSKAARLEDSEIGHIEALLSHSDIPGEDRVRLHFALGQAYGDREQYQQSFAQFAKGNALHYLSAKHEPEQMTSYVDRARAVLTKAFFQQHEGAGYSACDPIFIVGMPRSGSTLVEQILASHSQIEGTKELSDLLAAVSEHLHSGPSRTASFDADVLAAFDGASLKALGQRYVERTRAHRKTGRPFFTDKMPANFAYAGLIHLTLPNAKIIDIRRHPMACGFAIFTELFSGAHDVAYRLGDIGLAYRNYVRLMAHFDEALPGKIHRVFYEQLVDEPEREIRRMLEYLDVPFEQSCLQFHKTERVVTTRSSEQVRRPIYKAGVDRWRHYEPWLGPLKSALGPVLDAYPVVPVFD